MGNGGIVPGPVAPIEPERGCYIPLRADQSDEYHERVKAIWAESLTRWAADDG